ncbi:EAL domain-containing protein [Angustibacter aerolatus]
MPDTCGTPQIGVLTDAEVERVLDLAREHLGTDVAWVTEFTGGRQVIRCGSGDSSLLRAEIGGSTPMEETYCVRVLHGELPAVIPDARRHPVARDLAMTHQLGIGSYVGAPLHGPDGEVTGMLCAVGTAADPTLDDGAPRFLALLAALISDRMATPEAVRRRIALDESRAVQHLLTAGSMTTVYQPLVRLPDGKVVGYEALARFGVGAFRGPAQAFAAAARVGRGVELELAAARAAVAAVDVLPAGTTLTINLSAEALLDPCVNELLQREGLRALARGARLGVEITEHTHVPDYAPLLRVRERLRTIGVPLCIDDAGAGFASFRHVLQLRPDVIKVDVDLVRDVDTDPVRRALIRSLVGFAEEVDAQLLAEGVETPEEHDVLVELGVGLAQGYLHGRPAPLAAALATRTGWVSEPLARDA